jgi:hypothetical protein
MALNDVIFQMPAGQRAFSRVCLPLLFRGFVLQTTEHTAITLLGEIDYPRRVISPKYHSFDLKLKHMEIVFD